MNALKIQIWTDLPIKLGIVPEVFHSLLDRLLLGGLGNSLNLLQECGGDTGHTALGEGVDVEASGILLLILLLLL